MIKLLISVFAAATLALLILQLRQQRLELGYQSAQLHDQIRSQQARLWNQQMQIAVYTAPNAIAQTVKGHHLEMVPQTPLAGRGANWVEAAHEADAE